MFLAGLTHAEIGTLLNIDPHTVYTRLYALGYRAPMPYSERGKALRAITDRDITRRNHERQQRQKRFKAYGVSTNASYWQRLSHLD